MTDREKQIQIVRIQTDGKSELADSVAVEEPLEIRLIYGPPDQRRTRSLSVTMRTPGNDFELAAGFLVSESIISSPEDIVEQRFSGPAPEGVEQANTVEVELDPSVEFELQKLQRHFYTTSSCGVCGKTSLDAIRADNVKPIEIECQLEPDVILRLPELLRDQQNVFQLTGGLHGAGLGNLAGQILAVREDVGRHNAVDKLIGSQLLSGKLPLSDKVLVLSGRASFELMQKALLASIPIVVAVGAPSSLAVELAQNFNVTLVGFATNKKFNVYAGQQRIAD